MVYKEKNIGDVFRYIGHFHNYFDSNVVIMKRGTLVLVCDKIVVGKHKNGDDKIRLTLLTDNKKFNIKNKIFDQYFINVLDVIN